MLISFFFNGVQLLMNQYVSVTKSIVTLIFLSQWNHLVHGTRTAMCTGNSHAG